jgi:hypothetical protein
MITRTDLLDWLKEVDKNLKSKVVLIAVGGTAMTLRGLKPSTLDVDFCLKGTEVKIFRNAINENRFKVDIFRDGYIFSEQLPQDYIEKSNKVETGLKKIELKALSPVDIIITKAARYNERDEEDISTLFKVVPISKDELVRRFKEVVDTYSGRKKDYEYHFNLIIRRFLR